MKFGRGQEVPVSIPSLSPDWELGGGTSTPGQAPTRSQGSPRNYNSQDAPGTSGMAIDGGEFEFAFTFLLLPDPSPSSLTAPPPPCAVTQAAIRTDTQLTCSWRRDRVFSTGLLYTLPFQAAFP